MSQQSVSPYGSWKSPITSDLIVSGTVGLGQVMIDGDDVYWAELRPAEGGRVVVVRRSPNGVKEDLMPAPFNVRTRAHEYGGGSYAVADGKVYFSNFADQRLYCVEGRDAEPRPMTLAGVDRRYADAVIDQQHKRLIAVREDHTDAGREAVNSIVGLPLDGYGDDARRVAGSGADGDSVMHRSDEGGGEVVLISGHDFYSSLRVSPDGTRLAWLAWNHPNMPWDGCELWVGELAADGSLKQPEKIAGGESESIFQPEWSPDGMLYFVSDRSGWWNLYRALDTKRTEPVCAMSAEFGRPQWVFGMSTYAFESFRRIVCTFCENGTWKLGRIETVSGNLEPIETSYTEFGSLRASAGRAFFAGGSATERVLVAQLDLTTECVEVLRRSSEIEIDTGYLSVPEAIEYSTEDGLTAHAFFYAPRNRDHRAPNGERPPLLVMCHGGPTSATSKILNLAVQYWTSRGIAVLDVNYGGSSGYGRAYRERLNGRWGIVDVDDCINGARYLAERGDVDGDRCAITGGSAGGYTTLSALTFRNFFKAGASHFGVSDLAALVRDTHKFESRYLDRLVGTYPERADLYYERAPINFTERLSCPVIFFQGLEDKVVPPNQAELMVDALRVKKLPVAYVAFEGEQHGFRRAENIKRALDGELYFYSRVFGFELAEQVEPVPIENL